jgi:2-polyprenyl-3-methyl-5-hydroxy-6-metoxy-1,4-benzoquinol methylase
MSDWFEDWFNSDEYLTVYAHRDQTEAQKLLQLILNKVRLSKDSRILDLACGAGRHSLAFAKKGYTVTAIDLSESLLKIGRQEALKHGVSVDFRRQDIRSVKVDGFFQLVLNLFTSFGYFEKDEENFGIFRTAYGYLYKEGYFVFDFLNESYVKSHLVPVSQDEKNGCIIKQTRSIENGYVVKKIELRFEERLQTFFEKVKLYDYNTLTNELQKAGFTIMGLYGDYDGGKFNKETSSRLIAICKK